MRTFRKIPVNEVTASVIQRFLSHVVKTDGCWTWTGYVMPNGYGMASFHGNIRVYSHRLAYVIGKGEIPDGLDIDHLCRNRSCVNPEHLEAVTRRENLLRGKTIVAGFVTRNECVNGHHLNGANLRIYRGYRECRECHRLREQKRRDKLRMAA